MSNVTATSSFLQQLKHLYPTARVINSQTQVCNSKSNSKLLNPWYIVAAVAYSASNKSENVPKVFQHAMKDLNHHEDQRLLAQKMREALFKSGLISGYPRAINSLAALHEVMPLELRDVKQNRDSNTPLSDYEARGRALWNSIYGDTAESIQVMLNDIYPDMGWFSKTIGYGVTYSFTDILSPLETSFTLVAALIAGDTPQQIKWHLNGARRSGASLEEVQAVRKISMEVASDSGVIWKEGVPEIN